MKSDDLSVALTLDLFPLPKRRGRPKTLASMSNCDRQKKYRQRHKSIDVGASINASVSRLARDFDLSEGQVIRALLQFALCNRNWDQTGFPSILD